MLKPAKAQPDQPPRFAQTDQCVLCGLCLPHCPTYGLQRHEADSPRGRISLLQAIGQGRLALDAKTQGHLDRCLGCRACEAVCPSGVAYGQLLDQYHQFIAVQHQRTWRYRLSQRLIHGWLEHSQIRRFTAAGLRTVQALRLTPLFERMVRQTPAHPVTRSLSLLPFVSTPARRASAPASAKMPITVGLFSGCMAETFEGSMLEAACTVLEQLGYRVIIPPAQGCCGALSQHSGETKTAARLAQETLSRFAAPEMMRMVMLNSGCRAHFNGVIAHSPDPQAQAVAAKLQGFCECALAGDWTGLDLRHDPLRVALHTPCSLRHVLREVKQVETLLQKLPGMTLLPLPENARCCGGAGSYLLTQAHMADALLAPKLEALQTLPVDVLVTTNLGCALQFKTGLRKAGLAIPVLSPAELLLQRLVR
ncbi:(Fe-S)-binding protein [Thiorhodospira sibirica]|uniref:(Fe-S)-binding protein n=1 Tax=Thiorhodospira sibirica TaxID=154347 RepID=UPI0006824EB1|nr:(Fe-S)-binding protein [Thiorhodospira sibirica]